MIVNPAYMWRECPHCGARFKEDHYGERALHAVTDRDWEENADIRP